MTEVLQPLPGSEKVERTFRAKQRLNQYGEPEVPATKKNKPMTIHYTTALSIIVVTTAAWGFTELERVEWEHNDTMIAQDQAPVIGIELSFSPSEVAVGETISPEVALINESEEELVLVYSLDASDHSWRYPYVYYEIIDPSGAPVEIEIGRCGMMNSMSPEDLVPVGPGESFDPFGERGFPAYHFLVWTPDEPGVYQIRLIYDTTSEEARDWMGLDANVELIGVAAELFERVPHLRVESEWVELVVR